MNAKVYCRVSGTVFAAVALAHALRALAQWPIAIGGWQVPIALSWCAVVGAGALALWAFRSAARA